MKVFADFFYWLVIVPALFLLFLRACIMNVYCIMSDPFSVMIHTIWKNFFFSNIVDYTDYLSSFEAGLHLENKCHLTCCIILLIHCWILFANFLKDYFCLYWWRCWQVIFLYCAVLDWFQYQDNTSFIKWTGKGFFLLHVLEEVI